MRVPLISLRMLFISIDVYVRAVCCKNEQTHELTTSDAGCHRKKKENEAEAHLFGDKEAYVTSAYRKYQAEQAQHAADLEARCAQWLTRQLVALLAHLPVPDLVPASSNMNKGFASDRASALQPKQSYASCYPARV